MEVPLKKLTQNSRKMLNFHFLPLKRGVLHLIFSLPLRFIAFPKLHPHETVVSLEFFHEKSCNFLYFSVKNQFSDYDLCQKARKNKLSLPQPTAFLILYRIFSKSPTSEVFGLYNF